MARGSQDSLKTFYFKVEGLKKGSSNIYFKGRTKQNGEYVDLEDQDTWLEGNLIEIKTGEYEFEGKQKKTLSLILQDDEERYIIKGGYSGLMISVLNCLYNEESIGKVRIDVYINKNGFASAWVQNNGMETSWAWKPETLNAMKDITPLPNGENHVSNVRLVEFLEEKIGEINKRLAVPTGKTEEVEPVAEESVEDFDEELGF